MQPDNGSVSHNRQHVAHLRLGGLSQFWLLTEDPAERSHPEEYTEHDVRDERSGKLVAAFRCTQIILCPRSTAVAA